MKTHLEQFILEFYPKFHKFTLFCVICFFCYKTATYEYQADTHVISWLIEQIAPNVFESFESSTPFDPTDFANN